MDLVHLKLSSFTESSRKRRRDGMEEMIEDEKNLFVVLPGRTRLSYFSIPINPLIHLDGVCTIQATEDVVYPKVLDKAAFLMSCIAWKDSVYLIGGVDRDRINLVQDGTNLSREVISLKVRRDLLSEHPDSWNPMNSGKGLPLVFEHQDMLYVLADNFTGRNIPRHHFESYDPKTDKWDILETPPFYDSESEHYVGESPFSYVVTDNKICVATGCEAFAYDFICKRWEPCYLFGLTRYHPETFAFDFVGKGVLYKNKFLIAERFQGFVFAYKVCLGRVEDKQPLFEVAGDVIVWSLDALDEDHFCLMYTENSDNRKLVLVTFCLAILEGGSEEYLVCASKKTCEIDLSGAGVRDPLSISTFAA